MRPSPEAEVGWRSPGWVEVLEGTEAVLDVPAALNVDHDYGAGSPQALPSHSLIGDALQLHVGAQLLVPHGVASVEGFGGKGTRRNGEQEAVLA